MRLITTTLFMAGLLLAPAAWADSPAETAMNKAGCLACHMKDKKIVGPSYKAVAAKYKGQAGAAAKLIEKVRKGGQGSFGVIPMSPNPPDRISDADLKAAVDWILQL